MTHDEKITVRLVNSDDYIKVRDVAKDNHYESVFSEIEFCEDKFKFMFAQTIDKPEVAAGLIVEKEGRVQGYLYATLGEYFIGKGALITSVQTIYVSQDIRKQLAGGKIVISLIKAIKKWAEMRQVKYVMFHVTSGVNIKTTDRLFRRLGMSTLGGNYIYNTVA